MSIHPISFLLGLGAAVALPAIARIARPVVVELAAAGMALYDDAVRVASEKMETIEDIVAEARAKREAALAAGAVEAGAASSAISTTSWTRWSPPTRRRSSATPARIPRSACPAHCAGPPAGAPARLDEVRRTKALSYLGPDGKTLVAVEFEGRRPVRLHTVVISVQTTAGRKGPGGAGRELEDDIRKAVLDPVLDEAGIEFGRTARLFVNPGGPFVVGGPRRDAGLTGRKNTIDTYGGYSRHGGGALSGKDPDHIDRLGAYAARHVASNLVAAGLCAECEVHLAYAIGQAQPLTVSVQTFGTGVTPDEVLGRVVEETMDLRPAAILKQFRLRELPAQHEGVFYTRLASYGHFGRRDLEVPWESEDQCAALTSAARELA